MTIVYTYERLRREPLYTTMRSRLDNAIIELLFRQEIALREGMLSAPEKAKAGRGLAIRDFRYVFGAYKPKRGSLYGGPKDYHWLDPWRRDLLTCHAIDESFKKYSGQTISNHCGKLCRMGVLRKTGTRFTLGPDFMNNPETLRNIRVRVKNAKQEDCTSSGVVTIIGASKLKPPFFTKDVSNDVFKELGGFASKLCASIDHDRLRKLPTYPFMRAQDFPSFPLIVIDPNQVPEPRDYE